MEGVIERDDLFESGGGGEGVRGGRVEQGRREEE